MPTLEEIESRMTPNGGWTREILAEWGVSWPPPKGWKEKLLSVSDEHSQSEDAQAAECEACQRGPEGETPSHPPLKAGEDIEGLIETLNSNHRYLCERYGFAPATKTLYLQAIEHIASLSKRLKALEETLRRVHPNPADYRYWEGRYRDEAARSEALSKRLKEVESERDEAVLATHRQAFCIQQCAAHIGPDTSGTIDGLPNAVRALVAALHSSQSREAALVAALEKIARRARYDEPDVRDDLRRDLRHIEETALSALSATKETGNV